jgi:hypothetical protein
VPAFTGTQPGLRQHGPLVSVSVSPVAAAQEAILSAGGTILPPIDLIMLVDTGASSSVIAPGFAAQLGLQPVGVQQISTPSTTTPVSLPSYAARLTLPNGPFFETTVIEAPLGGQSINGLIGRDVLAECVLIYIGYTNQFTLAV